VLVNRKFIKETQPREVFDVVMGPAANDTVGLVLNQLLVGTYGDPESKQAQETAIRLLDTKKLYNQVFFNTPQALESLKFIESYGINRRTNTRSN
jgi:hypothetical protein